MTDQRTPEWFAARKGRVTGSNAGAALGVNPWKTPNDLIRQMVREVHGAEKEFVSNQATEWGSFNEAGAQSEYQMETGRTVQPCGFFPWEDWLGASPDGLLDLDGIVEIKCPYGQRDKNPPEFKTAEEQPHYYAQMQVEMICAGREWCDFYQWSPFGSSLERVYISERWRDENLPKLRAFYERFLSEIDNPTHLAPKRVNADTTALLQLAQEYTELSETIDLASQQKKKVLEAMVELSGGVDCTIGGRKLTHVERKGSIKYDKVPELQGVDLEPYRGKPVRFWRFS